mmetsp:Transcript_23081/g.44910  ORF Transcript_23081/g.44910 Transcript_23081/m.44910 type:complete len:201 (-) Transcript_23081:818-1420(-)
MRRRLRLVLLRHALQYALRVRRYLAVVPQRRVVRRVHVNRRRATRASALPKLAVRMLAALHRLCHWSERLGGLVHHKRAQNQQWCVHGFLLAWNILWTDGPSAAQADRSSMCGASGCRTSHRAEHGSLHFPASRACGRPAGACTCRFRRRPCARASRLGRISSSSHSRTSTRPTALIGLGACSGTDSGTACDLLSGLLLC